jgi:hypothetical protein
MAALGGIAAIVRYVFVADQMCSFKGTESCSRLEIVNEFGGVGGSNGNQLVQFWVSEKNTRDLVSSCRHNAG